MALGIVPLKIQFKKFFLRVDLKKVWAFNHLSGVCNIFVIFFSYNSYSRLKVDFIKGGRHLRIFSEDACYVIPQASTICLHKYV